MIRGTTAVAMSDQQRTVRSRPGVSGDAVASGLRAGEGRGVPCLVAALVTWAARRPPSATARGSLDRLALASAPTARGIERSGWLRGVPAHKGARWCT
jgi:hypothetical protein